MCVCVCVCVCVCALMCVRAWMFEFVCVYVSGLFLDGSVYVCNFPNINYFNTFVRELKLVQRKNEAINPFENFSNDFLKCLSLIIDFLCQPYLIVAHISRLIDCNVVRSSSLAYSLDSKNDNELILK